MAAAGAERKLMLEIDCFRFCPIADQFRASGDWPSQVRGRLSAVVKSGDNSMRHRVF